MYKLFKKSHIASFQIIILGFLGVIILGALLLMLPFATNDGNGADFGDALFTSTSAVCVTGLIVQDTATYWSFFGQFIILLMIQIGGLGVVTVALALTMASGRKVGLMQRSTMQEAISAPKVGGVVKMTGFILKGVFLIEALGAILLSFKFCPEFGFFKGLWYSIFHSVSAFCNAGFDLMGVKEQFSSLTSYSDDILVNITIMALIIIGGIGFLTWEDIITNKWRLRKYRMQSKVILSVSGILIIIPAVYFFFCEFSEQPLKERMLNSVFQSVTTRTAGFNTIDFGMLSEIGVFLMCILMLVGGSPGSTAGGMKTTTLAVMIASAIAVFRKKENASVFRRRIADSTLKNASAIFMMYVTFTLIGSMAIGYAEGVTFVTALFETASAIGTVGLTLGITPSLCAVSKLILIILMFFGRVGGLTLVFAAISGKGAKASKYPQESITVG